MNSKFAKAFVLAALTGASLTVGAARADSGYIAFGFGAPGDRPAPHYQPRGHFGPGHHDWGYRGPAWDPIDARQAMQLERIRAGIRSGELTPHEVRVLMSEQRGIEKMERRFEADGYLDPYERQRLERELREAGRNIAVETRDGQSRDAYGRRWD